jgi:lipopolysaccharide export system permease protein
MRSGGFSPLRISIISSIGAIGMILIFLVSDELYFKDISMNAEIEKNFITSNSDTKKNIRANWIEDEGTYLQYFIKDSETLYDVSIVKTKNDKALYSAYASEALIEENSIKLSQPFDYKNFEDSNVSYQKIPFKFPKVLQLSSPNIKNIKLRDQLDYLKNLEITKDGSFKSDLEKNIYKTLLLPISALAIMLLAGSLMFGSLRESTMGTKIIFGVIGGFIYGVIQDLTVSIFITYSLNILVSIILPILFVLGSCIFFYRKI